jgi:hypothetical protein
MRVFIWPIKSSCEEAEETEVFADLLSCISLSLKKDYGTGIFKRTGRRKMLGHGLQMQGFQRLS